MSGILPPLFSEIARFAGLEIELRGIGIRSEYDYSITDVLQVADAIKDGYPPVSIRRQAITLYNAYRRYKENYNERIPETSVAGKGLGQPSRRIDERVRKEAEGKSFDLFRSEGKNGAGPE